LQKLPNPVFGTIVQWRYIEGKRHGCGHRATAHSQGRRRRLVARPLQST